MKTRWLLLPLILLIVGAGQFQKSEELAKNSGCFACHKLDEKSIGPSFRDIAEKYKDDALARRVLIKVVKDGGKGNWPEIAKGAPMPSYSILLTDQEIAQLIDWVLQQ